MYIILIHMNNIQVYSCITLIPYVFVECILNITCFMLTNDSQTSVGSDVKIDDKSDVNVKAITR